MAARHWLVLDLCSGVGRPRQQCEAAESTTIDDEVKKIDERADKLEATIPDLETSPLDNTRARRNPTFR